MALFKISKGLSGNLPGSYHAGYCYFTTDNGKMYIDTTDDSPGRVVLNAGKADLLSTARKINGTAFNGSGDITTEIWGKTRTITIGNTAKTINGSGNVTWTLAQIGAAAASHTHSYLPLSGGTMTGDITFISIDPSADSTSYPLTSKGLIWRGSTDYAKIYYRVDGRDNGKLIVDLGDEGITGIIFASTSTDTMCLDTGNRQFYPTVTNSGTIGTSSYKWSAMYATTFHGALNGNANTATTWANTRNFSIADSNSSHTGTATGVNGGANITLKLPSTITATLNGNATSANSISKISLTGGDGNTTGYRLIYTWTISAWSNYRMSFIVQSRHTGSGLITLAVGNNSNTINLDNIYADIFYWGPVSDGTIIAEDSFQIYGSADGSKAYLFWKYSDYNTTKITPLTDTIPTNGNWMTSIAAATYGTLKARTRINQSLSLYNARTINGTVFNGTTNITTNSWGTSRTLTIGNTGKSVNGANNIAWSLTEIGALPASQKGIANGVASLGSDGKVLSSQLPSYVDDVIEGYYSSGKFYKESGHTTVITGESSKIYVDLHTKKTYRWSGSTYVEISTSIVIGTTSGTALDGGTGTSHINNKSNPHGVTKAQVGLGNVTNYDQAKAIKSITRSGTTFTYTCLDGTTGTFTQQDSNTVPAIIYTSAGNAAKTAICSSYQLATHNRIQIFLVTSNSAQSALTLSINGTGAKPIYINGIASSSSNYTLPKGSYNIYYDGTNYYFRTDGLITGSITGNAASATKLATARTINGTSFDGTANITTANWGTARYIYISDATGAHTGAAVSVNGGGNATLKLPATITAALNGNADSATKLTTSAGSSQLPVYFNEGKPVACSSTLAVSITGNATTTNRTLYHNKHVETASGTTANAPSTGMLYSSGLYLTGTYNDSATPVNYGNIINLAGSGTGQLLCEWKGTDNTTGHLYYRSHRDTSTGGWGPWITILDSSNYNSYALPLSGGTITGQLVLSRTNDIAGNDNKYPCLIVGGTIGTDHLEFDSNEIMAKRNAITPGDLYLNADGGNVYLGKGGVYSSGTALYGNLNGNATSATKATNDGNGANIASTYLKCSGGTMTGQIQKASNDKSWYDGRDGAIIRNTATVYTNNQYNPLWSVKSINGSWDCGTYTADNSLYFTYITDANYNSHTNTITQQIYFKGSDGSVHAKKVYGAVWNDYAEFRTTEENIEPGRCIVENGDDTLSLSTQRLQRGCEIVSDTFGFAIGETDKSRTPIAASGRVLAYPYESREEFAKHIGWPVCSGPNGTVSIMTEEEEEKYSSRIIGTISAVPDYEEWGTGKVKVNGRVWIRIK